MTEEEQERRTPSVPPSELLEPEKLFRRVDKIRKEASPLEPLWGYFLFKKAVTSIVGDPGIGKTSMGYGMAKELCLGQPFLGVYPEEPISTLYMDFESADSLVASRSNLIIGDGEVPNFYIYNGVEYYLPQIAELTVKFCRKSKINLLFIDNQSLAFNTRDENDNAEAIRQMRFIRSFTMACDVACVLFHHTSKANLPGIRKGTGAFGRARLADICLNLETPSEDEPNIIRLETVKNRLIDEKVLWYIKKEEGKFVFTEPPLGVSGKPTNTLIYRAQRELLGYFQVGEKYKVEALTSTFCKDGITVNILDKALRKLVQQGRVKKPEWGYYEKVSLNEMFNIKSREIESEN